MKAIIDADQAVYAACYSTQGKAFSKTSSLFDFRMEQITRTCRADSMTVVLGGAGNFREEIAITKPYKGGRKNEKPEDFLKLRDYVQSEYPVEIQDGLEADDVCAILVTEGYVSDPSGLDKILVSPDKDLLQVPGLHFNPLKPENGVFLVDEEEAHWFFCQQLLSGDSTDNIPGLPYLTPELFDLYEIHRYGPRGVAEKRSADILHKSATEPMLTVEFCYSAWAEAEGLSRDEGEVYLLEQGTLLFMVRKLDKRGFPVLWELPFLSENV